MITYVEVPTIGTVRISKRKGTTSMRISLHQNGEVRLSMPPSIQTQAGIDFLLQKKTWIQQHKNTAVLLEEGARIGNAHTLRIITTTKRTFRTYTTQNQLIVYAPETYSKQKLQTKIVTAAKDMLQKQAEEQIPLRTQELIAKHAYRVLSITCKPLKARWGSCSSKNELVFNTYLLQLPWRLIDYVIFHELAHTVHHNHSEKFWQEVHTHVPDYKERRRMLKKYPTDIFDARTFA